MTRVIGVYEDRKKTELHKRTSINYIDYCMK